MVLTEPDAGSDVGAGRTRAIQQPDGTWHIEGVKRFITCAEHDMAENIFHLVLARPEGHGPGTKGLSMFLVPKFLVGPDGTLGERNGVDVTAVEHKMGLHASTTCELTFGADRPAVGTLVGDKHDGIRQMFVIIEAARMMVGTKAIARSSATRARRCGRCSPRSPSSPPGSRATAGSSRSGPRWPARSATSMPW
jgi:alkylation response protein AidB-like acyl-CoA dehydrogenase